MAIMELISRWRAAGQGRDAAAVAWKLARSTGKAAWIAGTSLLVLAVPLIYILEREGQMNELEAMQQMADQSILFGADGS